ncbi:MAG: hypothetical protein ACJATN_000994 [Neolewinella sp.]|jgi:hypothetical protein
MQPGLFSGYCSLGEGVYDALSERERQICALLEEALLKVRRRRIGGED